MGNFNKQAMLGLPQAARENMTVVRPPSATWTRRQTSRLELIMLRIMFFMLQVEGVQPLLDAYWLAVLEGPETQASS